MSRPATFKSEPEMDSQVIEHAPAESTSTDIVVAVTKNPGLVLLDGEKFNAWYEKLKAKAPTATDMTVRKDREALRSYAADVRSEKAAIDKARLRLTKEWRDMVSQANEAGKTIEQQLESLAAEVRKPLTDWEDAEKARVAECRAIIDGIWAAALVTLADTAATVRARGTEVYQIELDPERFGELLDEAQSAKEHVIGTLRADLVRLVQAEADTARLAELEAKEAEREARETAEREAREKKAQHDRYIESLFQHIRDCGIGIIGGQPYGYGLITHELTEKIVIDEEWGDRADEGRKLLAETIARVNEANEKAVEQRRIEEQRAEDDRIAKAAEKAAQDERDRLQTIHDDELAAAAKRAEDAEAAVAAERKKAEDDAAARKVEEDRLAAEQRQRDVDQDHRKAVMGEAKVAIMTCFDEDMPTARIEAISRAIVLAIVGENVPHVTLSF